MVKTTKPQRQTIKRIFARGNDWARDMPATYKELRKRVQPVFCCAPAICLPIAGMWLCIEDDGYTHS